jgi:hypothetical protein
MVQALPLLQRRSALELVRAPLRVLARAPAFVQRPALVQAPALVLESVPVQALASARVVAVQLRRLVRQQPSPRPARAPVSALAGEAVWALTAERALAA